MEPRLIKDFARRPKPALLAGAALVLGMMLVGCDEQVQALVYSGLNELAVTMVDAFFVAIAPVEQAAG